LIDACLATNFTFDYLARNFTFLTTDSASSASTDSFTVDDTFLNIDTAYLGSHHYPQVAVASEFLAIDSPDLASLDISTLDKYSPWWILFLILGCLAVSYCTNLWLDCLVDHGKLTSIIDLIFHLPCMGLDCVPKFTSLHDATLCSYLGALDCVHMFPSLDNSTLCSYLNNEHNKDFSYRIHQLDRLVDGDKLDCLIDSEFGTAQFIHLLDHLVERDKTWPCQLLPLILDAHAAITALRCLQRCIDSTFCLI
jgi:hypothetical protein